MALTLRITSYQNATLGEDRSKIFDGVGGSLGRSPSADWVLPDPKRYISNKHASIEYKDNAYYVTDLSTNGVYINDATDALGKNNTVKLDNGDKLSIGDYQIEVSCDEQAIDSDIFANEYQALTGEYAANHQESAQELTKDNGIDMANTGSDYFVANVPTPPGENEMSGSISSSKDPLDLFGPSERSDPGQSQQSQNHDPFGVFDAEPDQSSRLLDHNPGLHENFTPPSAKSENLIPDDWDLTHFPARDQNNSNANHPDSTNSRPEAANANSHESTDEFPQTPESIFDELPDSWGQTGFAKDSHPQNHTNIEQHTSIPSHFAGVGSQQSQQAYSNTSLPNFDSSSSFAPETPLPGSVGSTPENKRTGAARKPSQTSRGDEYEIFLQSIGLDINNIPAEMAGELPHILGTVFKELVKGTMEVLNARANLKGAFRVSQTIIQPVENNPLKFSVNLEDAIRNMLFNQGTGYLSALEAIHEGFADIKAHQMAMMAGMQAAVTAMMQRFDPNELAKHFDNTKGAGVFNKKAKYWDMYGDLFVKISRAAEDNFQNLLGEEFAEAYEIQMSKLKASGKPMGRKSNF